MAGANSKLKLRKMMTEETKKQIKTELGNYVAKMGGQSAASRKMLNVSNATISNILADKWDNIAEQMWTSIQKQVSTETGWLLVRNTRRFKQANKFYTDAQQYSEVYCLIAPEGTGKSAPAKEYANDNANVWLLTCKEHYNRKTFLFDLLKAMGKDGSGYTVYDMLDEVVKVILFTANPLIILDEADKLSDQALYFFISIYNATEDKSGIIIQATEHFKNRMAKGCRLNRKGFREIFSRFGRKYIEVKPNTLTELRAIIEANGISESEEQTRIINDSEGDIRRIKRLVKAYLRSEKKEDLS